MSCEIHRYSLRPAVDVRIMRQMQVLSLLGASYAVDGVLENVRSSNGEVARKRRGNVLLSAVSRIV